MQGFEPFIKEVRDICRKAGEAILEIYENEKDFGVESKADESPLTIADQKANKIICDALAKMDYAFPIISEENKEVPYEDRKSYAYYWLVDPLDGTKEFIKRNGEFTVNIALIKEDTVVAGVVYAPVLDEMYWALKGAGAFVKYKGSEPQALSATKFSESDKALKIVCSRSHLNEATQTFVDQYESPDLVPKGSSLKFLILAQGAAQVYPRLAPTMEWDTAAAQIIVEEAGGKVINYDTKEPLKYNKEVLRNPSFVAYGNLV